MPLRQITFTPKADILQLLPLDVAKANRRVRHTSEDSLFEKWIVTAFHYLNGLQGFTRTPLLETEFELVSAALSPAYELPLPRVGAITGLSYMRDTGLTVDVDASRYELATIGPAQYLRAIPNPGVPFVPTGPLSLGQWPVSLRFKAGLPLSRKDDAPELIALSTAMLLMVGHFDANREATVIEGRSTAISQKVQFGIEDLLGKFVLPLRIG